MDNLILKGSIMKTAFTAIVGLLIVILIGYWCQQAHQKPTKPSHSPAQTITAQIWRVTAYCPCEKCCGRFSDGITASGSPAKGKLIAAPKSIPFGTWINIKGYGYAEVLDRGGAIKGKRLDVFFSTHQEALNWGVQYLEIE